MTSWMVVRTGPAASGIATRNASKREANFRADIRLSITSGGKRPRAQDEPGESQRKRTNPTTGYSLSRGAARESPQGPGAARQVILDAGLAESAGKYFAL